MKLLLLEDDLVLRDEIAGRLRRDGFAVDTATTLAQARFQLDTTSYDAAILDRTVPDGDATTLVADVRAAGSSVPVLFLTARGDISERVEGFESGGDDYLVKPFAAAELLARVRSLTSRRDMPKLTILQVGVLRMDVPRHQVTQDDVLLSMTPKEFAVLQVLMGSPGTVITRSDLIDACWDDMHDPASNVVDVLIWQLRRTLGDPPVIETVRGRGYRITASE